jgi:hypothetical protein
MKLRIGESLNLGEPVRGERERERETKRVYQES